MSTSSEAVVPFSGIRCIAHSAYSLARSFTHTLAQTSEFAHPPPLPLALLAGLPIDDTRAEFPVPSLGLSPNVARSERIRSGTTGNAEVDGCLGVSAKRTMDSSPSGKCHTPLPRSRPAGSGCRMRRRMPKRGGGLKTRSLACVVVLIIKQVRTRENERTTCAVCSTGAKQGICSTRKPGSDQGLANRTSSVICWLSYS